MRCCQFLLAGRDQLHRPSGGTRQQRRIVFQRDPQLAAEAAADARDQNADARDRQLQYVAQRGLHFVWQLPVAPHGQRTIAFPSRRRGTRLGVTGMHDRRREAMLIDTKAL